MTRRIAKERTAAATQTKQALMLAAFNSYRAQKFNRRIATLRTAHDFPNEPRINRSYFFNTLESARLHRKTMLIVSDQSVRLAARYNALESIKTARNIRTKEKIHG